MSNTRTIAVLLGGPLDGQVQELAEPYTELAYPIQPELVAANRPPTMDDLAPIEYQVAVYGRTTSTTTRGETVYEYRGLQQGDPLSR